MFQRYLYRISFSMDGNFSLQKKTKEEGEEDIALCQGRGFFIPHADMLPTLVQQYGLPQGATKSSDRPGADNATGAGVEIATGGEQVTATSPDAPVEQDKASATRATPPKAPRQSERVALKRKVEGSTPMPSSAKRPRQAKAPRKPKPVVDPMDKLVSRSNSLWRSLIDEFETGHHLQQFQGRALSKGRKVRQPRRERYHRRGL